MGIGTATGERAQKRDDADPAPEPIGVILDRGLMIEAEPDFPDGLIFERMPIFPLRVDFFAPGEVFQRLFIESTVGFRL